MAITTTYSFGSVATQGDLSSSFDYPKLDSDILAFSSAYNAKEGIPINTWANNIVILDETLETIKKQSKNTVFVDATHVKKVTGSTGSSSTVALDPLYVNQSDCVLKFAWGDSLTPTTLESAKFYAYDLVANDVDTAPTGVTIVGFEHTGATIRKNRVGDATGKAWTSTYGIGGRSNGLSLATQSSALTHYYYLGFSIKPTAYGNSTFAFCIEFDVS